MSLQFEQDTRNEALLSVAHRMMTAARTAPKGCGIDHLVIALAQKEDIEIIAQKMIEMAQNNQGGAFFARDAENLLQSGVMVLIGTKIEPLGLSHCGNCGYANCDEKRKLPDVPCAFNTGDLGIAIGSAVSVAMDARVDNRIMFSAGKAVKALNLMGDDVKIIYGIPLSSAGKNIFFDRTIQK